LAEKDRCLERRTLRQWPEAKQLGGKVDKRELGRSHGGLRMARGSRNYTLSEKQLRQRETAGKPLNQPNKNPQSCRTKTRQQSGKCKAVSFVTMS
jgi:hypothetical protein